MNLKNKGFSPILIISVIAIAILLYFWPLPAVKKDGVNAKVQVNASGYKLAADGVFGLRDKAILFYNRTGRMPNTADLLNAPLDSQSTTSLKDSGYLRQHNLGIIGLFPNSIGQCKAAIKIEGIYDNNGLRIIYNIITVNLAGDWKSICMYHVEGASPASIQVDNCLSVEVQKVELQKQTSSLKSACGS